MPGPGKHPNSRANLKAKGPNYGNKGGPGRPKDIVVAACRLAFEERISVLIEIADNKLAKDRDRIAAVEKLGEFGGLKKIDVTSNDESIIPQLTIAVTYADPVDPSETS
jgi:hypothetical protein